MAQNMKVILYDVNNKVPNNINFKDTIKIRGGSKLALTSFNASFEINNIGVLVKDQSFDFFPNYDENVDLPAKNVVLPSKTYQHKSELDDDLFKAINREFSAFEINNFDNELSLVGMALTVNESSSKKTLFNIDTYKLEQFNYPAEETGDFTIDANGYYDTVDDTVEFLATTPVSNILMKGGGVAYQYNERFNLTNKNFNSYMKVFDQNNDSMSLYYQITKDGNGAGKLKLKLFVRIVKDGVSTDTPISNTFFNYDLFINQNGINPTQGPWSQSQATINSSYFMWFQKLGRWEIIFFDGNTDLFHTVFTEGLEYNITNNYRFEKFIQQPSIKNVQFNANFNKATLNTKLVGSKTIKSKIEFNNCNTLKEIYALNDISKFLPENNYSSVYTPNYETEFFPLQNFEISCEIDTIKIKNFVGSSDGSEVGRRNVLAYFTPETTISQSKYIYSFDPSDPIYLSVDSDSDIDLNSIRIRFYNTYNGEGFVADTISCVLTNM